MMDISRRRLLATTGGGVAAATVLAHARALRAADPIKTAAIYTVPIEQQWVSRIHLAANTAKDRGDIDYVFSESVANTDYERVMREYAEAGHQLIIGEAFAVEEAAVFDNYIQDASYLTGMIAGAVTKKGSIGMVGGYPIPEVNRLMNAFMKGVAETNTSVKFQVAFIGSWFDPPKAKETALAQIDAGADVMYAERFGVSDAAKEKGILAIGNVINTQADYPNTVVASALWHFEPTLDRALGKVKDKSFAAEDYGEYSFMKHGGCSLAPLGTFEGKVPAEVAAKVTEREKAIKSGGFTVEINDNEPKSS